MKSSQKVSVGCAVCGHTIAESQEAGTSPAQLAEQAKAASVEVKSAEGAASWGWLCQQCESTLLLPENTLRRVVKTAGRMGNSSAVYLPSAWEGGKVAAYLLNPPNTMCAICGKGFDSRKAMTEHRTELHGG